MRVRPENLYQVFAYVENLTATGEHQGVEGILLYPTVNRSLDLRYSLLGRRISVRTIDLNQSWQGIHKSLVELVQTS